MLEQKGSDILNPLQTPVIFAIQSVSRRERARRAQLGEESEEFTQGQYLCTGLDCYVVNEPDFYEAMALLHSRIARIIFSEENKASGGLGGCGGIERGIHSLKDTNHKFRVFQVEKDGDV
jgi:tRNA-specific adenosine deaminase 3